MRRKCLLLWSCYQNMCQLIQDPLPGPDPAAWKHFAHDKTSERWTNVFSDCSEWSKTVSRTLRTRREGQQGVRSTLCRQIKLLITEKNESSSKKSYFPQTFSCAALINYCEVNFWCDGSATWVELNRFWCILSLYEYSYWMTVKVNDLLTNLLSKAGQTLCGINQI